MPLVLLNRLRSGIAGCTAIPFNYLAAREKVVPSCEVVAFIVEPSIDSSLNLKWMIEAGAVAIAAEGLLWLVECLAQDT